MSNTRQITLVSSRNELNQNITFINNQLNTITTTLNSVQDLLMNFNHPSYTSDLVVFDLDDLCSLQGMDVFEIGTLINMINRVNNRIKIPTLGVLVDKDSKPAHIKQILDTDIKGMIPNANWFGVDYTLEAVRNLLEGKHHMPKKILDHYFAKTKVVSVSKLPELTPRQSQVMNLISSRGASNKVIARSLRISESTVKVHIGAIFKKYGVKNRTQLALCGLNGKL